MNFFKELFSLLHCDYNFICKLNVILNISLFLSKWKWPWVAEMFLRNVPKGSRATQKREHSVILKLFYIKKCWDIKQFFFYKFNVLLFIIILYKIIHLRVVVKTEGVAGGFFYHVNIHFRVYATKYPYARCDHTATEVQI